MTHNKDQVTIDVERALAHMLAHDLNNALGAIDVLTEMLGDDAADAALYTDKIQLAARLARAQVQALRIAVPKPGQGQRSVRFGDAVATAQLMMGDGGIRLNNYVPDDVVVGVPVSVATYVLYHVIAHVAGCVSGSMACRLAVTNATPIAVQITADGPIAPLNWVLPLWDEIQGAHGVTVEPLAGQGAHGFILQWPVAAV